MIVILEPQAEIAPVVQALAARGLWVRRFDGESGTHLAIEPHSAQVSPKSLLDIRGVRDVVVAASERPRLDTHPCAVRVGDRLIGRTAAPTVLAGPCAVESEEQIERIAAEVAAAGAVVLRGGAFKPRTSPYSFSGHGRPALAWLRRAADRHGLAVVTEVLAPQDAESVAEHADLLQIGSRNMQNFALLRAAAAQGRPILLKRGLAATIDEWLAAAEHCLSGGASGVVLCERGIRSFDPNTRNLLDLGAVALLSQVHGLPVVVDPSHATGRRDLVPTLCRAALSAGAHGLLLEVHDRPGAALSDGPQALPPSALRQLCRQLEGVTS